MVVWKTQPKITTAISKENRHETGKKRPHNHVNPVQKKSLELIENLYVLSASARDRGGGRFCRVGDIMEKILVNTEQFNGRYVAMKNFDENTIVGVGDNPENALKDAESKGHENAVILYVPEKDTVHIYRFDSARLFIQ
ncbi:MAG: hypothetical protein KKG10_08340 [Proteobacteria bacterium]|nr:hypothetical protein [Pseudomonadota bacterium]